MTGAAATASEPREISTVDIIPQKGIKVNIDVIIDGLQKAVDELKEEREHILQLEQKTNNLITAAQLWFDEHWHELPKGE